MIDKNFNLDRGKPLFISYNYKNAINHGSGTYYRIP